jgi:DNA-binding NarL/FixJ family response regulator
VEADGSADLWTLTRQPPAVMLAVLARAEADVDGIAEALAHDGLLVTVVFAGLTDMGLDMLVPPPDVVIVNASAGDFDAASAILRARRALPDAGIVVICPPGARRAWSRYLEAGADGIVSTDDAVRTLGPVLRCVRVGHIAVPGAARLVLSPPALSYREKEVLELAAHGLTNSQIAGRLFLAESTVKTHLSSAFRRLGVSSRREAAALLRVPDNDMRRRLLPPSPEPVPGAVPAVGAEIAAGG